MDSSERSDIWSCDHHQCLMLESALNHRALNYKTPVLWMAPTVGFNTTFLVSFILSVRNIRLVSQLSHAMTLAKTGHSAMYNYCTVTTNHEYLTFICSCNGWPPKRGVRNKTRHIRDNLITKSVCTISSIQSERGFQGYWDIHWYMSFIRTCKSWFSKYELSSWIVSVL